MGGGALLPSAGPLTARVIGMKARTGRPPKKPDPGQSHTTLTVRLSAADKQLLVEMADGYGMTMTEYLVMLVARDARGA